MLAARDLCRKTARWIALDTMDIANGQRLTVSVEEAGQLLGISRAKAYECARTGELPTKRFGKRMVVSLDSLRRLLDVAEMTAAS